jgi:uncharacterized protein (DUF433 family)
MSVVYETAVVFSLCRKVCGRSGLRMKAIANGASKPVELGRYIVVDPGVCHGQPTYKGTRIMVWQILEGLADGESVDDLVKAWAGRVKREAVLETIRLAGANLLNANGTLRHRHINRRAA